MCNKWVYPKLWNGVGKSCNSPFLHTESCCYFSRRKSPGWPCLLSMSQCFYKGQSFGVGPGSGLRSSERSETCDPGLEEVGIENKTTPPPKI